MDEPRWLRESVVLAIHGEQLAEHGGGEGIRDQGLLSSALARPRNSFLYSERADLPSLAAAYAAGILQNHPFVDGNKRTAYVACRAFLILNGKDLAAPRKDKYLAFLALAEGRLGEEELADWLRGRLVEP